MARLEAEIAVLKNQLAAGQVQQAQQQTMPEMLVNIKDSVTEIEPRNNEQAARKLTLQQRLQDLILVALGTTGAELFGAAIESEVYPQLKQAMQDLLRWAGEVHASENPPPARTPTPQPAPQARPDPQPRPGTETPAPKSVAVDFEPPELVRIPAGTFLLGEEPRRFHLPTYHIAKTPTTVAQFAAFVQATGYRTTAEKRNDSWTWRTPRFRNVRGVQVRSPRDLRLVGRRCRLLRVAITQERAQLPAADHCRMGEGRPWHGWAYLPVGWLAA